MLATIHRLSRTRGGERDGRRGEARELAGRHAKDLEGDADVKREENARDGDHLGDEEVYIKPVPGVCGQGQLVLTWLANEGRTADDDDSNGGGGGGVRGGSGSGSSLGDRARVSRQDPFVSKNITHVRSFVLPADSAVLHCEAVGGVVEGQGEDAARISEGRLKARGQAPRQGAADRGGRRVLTQLIVEPRSRAKLQKKAALAEVSLAHTLSLPLSLSPPFSPSLARPSSRSPCVSAKTI